MCTPFGIITLSSGSTWVAHNIHHTMFQAATHTSIGWLRVDVYTALAALDARQHGCLCLKLREFGCLHCC